MQPIKDRDNVHVILLEDGSYWMLNTRKGGKRMYDLKVREHFPVSLKLNAEVVKH